MDEVEILELVELELVEEVDSEVDEVELEVEDVEVVVLPPYLRTVEYPAITPNH